MGLDFNQAVSVITSGTTDFIGEWWPLLAFLLGLTIAFELMFWLISFVSDLQDARSMGIPMYEYRKRKEQYFNSLDDN